MSILSPHFGVVILTELIATSSERILFFNRRAMSAWNNSENLVLLENTAVARLPIFSFLIRHPISGLFLHHNFVCALLNDLFGIQARGGCACAGPYAQVLFYCGCFCTLHSRSRPSLIQIIMTILEMNCLVFPFPVEIHCNF